MRLFIAVELGNLDFYFKELQQNLPEAKATHPKHFHLTLKFLGEVEEKDVAEINERLKKVKFEPFEVSLGKLGVFPDEKFIRVVWVGLEDGEKIIQLQQDIDNTLDGLFKKDSRFHSHITLARIKFIPEDKKEDFINAIKSIEVEPKTSKIEKFKLIKSTLTGEGPVYEDLEAYG